MKKEKRNNLEKILDFLHIVEKLKATPRDIHTSKGTKDSSAEHSWRLSLMVFLIAGELEIQLDLLRALKIALVHDLAESITGDYSAVMVAEGKISKEEKSSLEKKAMQEIKAALPKKNGEEIYNLWSEYEEGKTPEARYVKALDKLEAVTQLIEAGHQTYYKPDFIPNCADKAVNNFPALKGMLKIIKQELKAEFKKGRIPWVEEYEKIK